MFIVKIIEVIKEVLKSEVKTSFDTQIVQKEVFFCKCAICD